MQLRAWNGSESYFSFHYTRTQWSNYQIWKYSVHCSTIIKYAACCLTLISLWTLLDWFWKKPFLNSVGTRLLLSAEPTFRRLFWLLDSTVCTVINLFFSSHDVSWMNCKGNKFKKDASQLNSIKRNHLKHCSQLKPLIYWKDHLLLQGKWILDVNLSPHRKGPFHR